MVTRLTMAREELGVACDTCVRALECDRDLSLCRCSLNYVNRCKESRQRLDAFEPSGKPGIGEVVGIPKPIRNKFSRRRVAIEAAMIEHGVRTAHGAQIAHVERPAAIDAHARDRSRPAERGASPPAA